MTPKERRSNVVLWVMGHWIELVEKGYCKPLPQQLTPKGIAAFDQLQASGFHPTGDEIRQAIKAIQDYSKEGS